MGEIKWTNEQQKVIDTRNCNLLVAAAAGSGKTAVLVERIITIITDKRNPIDIDKLLVVTFTNAAASEMRERIGEALSKEIGRSGHNVRLQRQLTLLNKASITTIHSFCLNVIRNNFHKIDIDPNFRVADDTEVLLLKGEAIEELFEYKYESVKDKDIEDDNIKNKAKYKLCIGEDFLNLVETYCSNRKDDIALMELVFRLHNFAIGMPNPKEWLIEKSEEFNVKKLQNIEQANWIKVLQSIIEMKLIGIKKKYLEAYSIVDNTKELDAYKEIIEEELALINDLNEDCKNSFFKFIKSLESVKFERLPSVRNIEEKYKKDRVQDIRNNVKSDIEDLKKNYCEINKENIEEGYIRTYPIIKNLCYLVLQFDELYKEKKKEKGIIDFNDFEHFCLDILIEKDEKGNWLKNENGRYKASDIALELREKYKEILIDEYQDSNLVQELILNMVSKIEDGEPNIFMVGDIKQSIYRFRQAKPELFLNKYNTYTENEDSLYQKILLFKNFRSRNEVLQGVNFIFKSIMSEKVGELEYDGKETLNLGANYEKELKGGSVGGPIELHLLEKEAKEDVQEEKLEEDELATDIVYEARITARRIKELIEKKENAFKILDKQSKEYRPVKYKDIVILLRSTLNWSEQFMEEFKKYNIPIYADTNTGYFETIEIKTILSLLQTVDNPVQDIPLLSVMKSPIGGFSAEDFIDIRINNNNNNISFYEACKIYINTNDNELKNRLQEFFNKLAYWREKALHTPIDEFIWYIYMETGYYGFVGALKGGIQRQANLKVLFQRARDYKNTSYSGLFNFINFINKLRKTSGDMGSAKILGENEDVVRIMSIHKSKGLEFPVVFLCGLGKQFNLRDLNSNLLLHHSLGFGPDIIDFRRRITYPLPIKKAIREKLLIETLSEEMRILYVALTRAKEKLILVGGVKNIVSFISKCKNSISHDDYKVPEFSTINARTYLEWIMMSIIRHKDVFKILREEMYNYSGKEIEEIEEIEEKNLIEDNSKWAIKFWTKNQLYDIEEIDDKDRGECLKNILCKYVNKKNELYDKFIEKILSYEYPYKDATKLPTVLTVSELKRKFNSLERENTKEVVNIRLKKRPNFMEGKIKLSATEKGTAFHSVMEYVDLSKVSSIEEIKHQVFDMYTKELITEDESKVIDYSKIFKFFKSDLGQRMIKSYPKVYRESEFHIPLISSEVFKELDKNQYEKEKILLQGIIDCYFEEDGEIVLLDYKTDFILEGAEQKLINKYKVQLYYYKRAVEIITRKKVKEIYLYLFFLDKYLRID